MNDEWRDPPSEFVPNQEHWCYACDHYDGSGEIPMKKDYPEACKRCSFLNNEMLEAGQE